MARIRHFGGYRRAESGAEASRDHQWQIRNTGMPIHLRYEPARPRRGEHALVAPCQN